MSMSGTPVQTKPPAPPGSSTRRGHSPRTPSASLTSSSANKPIEQSPPFRRASQTGSLLMSDLKVLSELIASEQDGKSPDTSKTLTQPSSPVPSVLPKQPTPVKDLKDLKESPKKEPEAKGKGSTAPSGQGHRRNKSKLLIPPQSNPVWNGIKYAWEGIVKIVGLFDETVYLSVLYGIGLGLSMYFHALTPYVVSMVLYHMGVAIMRCSKCTSMVRIHSLLDPNAETKEQ